MIDPHRPRYHFVADRWMNDPIPFEHDGVYHIYYQYNPFAAVWGHMHWGHAASRDLCHWETLPVALAPGLPTLGPGETREGGTAPGPDKDGIFTGCVTQSRTDGRFYALYTGISPQVQCVAVSDDLLNWEKPDGNPVVGERPPAEPGQPWGDCFRDPQTFLAPDGQRYVVVGGEQPEGKGGAAFLYRVEDESGMATWTYLHPLFLGGPETGFDFECPDFFPLTDDEGNPTDRWLLISSRNRTWWHLGTLDTATMRFSREAYGICDTGNYYAAKTLIDGDGRRVLFGWVTEPRPQAEQVAAGWSGTLSLPRIVTLGPENRPRFAFAPELSAMCGEPIELSVSLTEEPTDLGEFSDRMELEARFTGTTGGATVTLRYGDAEPVALEISAGETATLHLFADGSVIEAIVNGTDCRTLRVYPTTGGPVVLALSAPQSGTATLRIHPLIP